MKISTILDHIDSGHLALPAFQRGYVWNRDQVRGFFHSIYKRHPVGGLLVWATKSETAKVRGGKDQPPGTVKLLLNGQQRTTSLYGAVRGRPPKFFDGDPKMFTGLCFHMESKVFEFRQPVKMRDDLLWVDVTDVMQGGMTGVGKFSAPLPPEHDDASRGEYMGRLCRLIGIGEIELHVEEISGEHITIDVVVDIFNRADSGGTKLSRGDLTLAKVCAGCRRAAGHEGQAGGLGKEGLPLQPGMAVAVGEHSPDRKGGLFPPVRQGGRRDPGGALKRTVKHIDDILSHIMGRLGLDHDRVFFGRCGVPVLARFFDPRRQRGAGPMSAMERDKLLFRYAQAAMWGRSSGSTESNIDRDIEALEGEGGGLEKLLERLRRGGLRTEPGRFTRSSIGARFYPVPYMLTRMEGARDWGTGQPVRLSMNKFKVHHIFPKSQLYKRRYNRLEVNALANFCFLTEDSNRFIRNRLPSIYFPQVERSHPDALASQWVPKNRRLWIVGNFLEFLDARKRLLADELNRQMESLLHGDTGWLDAGAASSQVGPLDSGGISSEEDGRQLTDLNEWVAGQGMDRGVLSCDRSDPETSKQKAVFDLAWPNGVQKGLGQPVAVLLNEDAGTIAMANDAGFRCFTSVDEFKRYLSIEVLSAGSGQENRDGIGKCVLPRLPELSMPTIAEAGIHLIALHSTKRMHT